jgi:hypothetical protein
MRVQFGDVAIGRGKVETRLGRTVAFGCRFALPGMRTSGVGLCWQLVPTGSPEIARRARDGFRRNF